MVDPPESGAAQSKEDACKAHLGILFVHGIGQQVAGQTLVQYADPLSRWLTRWLTRGAKTEAGVGRPDGIRVRLGDTTLAEGDEPAHLTMTIEAAPDIPAAETQRWVLAESWWAETFRPPATRQLILWMLLILPYLILVQFYAMFVRAWKRSTNSAVKVLRVGAYAVVYASALPLAALGAVVLVVMLAGILFPIPQVSERAKKAALLLSNTLGDSYVLVSSAVQFDAMVTRVARDLAWLAAEAKNVIVVAHSQGTAVSYHAISGYEFPTNLRAFVTIGEALKKLGLVRELETFGSSRETVPRLQKPPLPESIAEFRGDLRQGTVRILSGVWRTVKRWLKLKSLRFTFAWVGLLGVCLSAYSFLLLGLHLARPHVVLLLVLAGAGLAIALAVSVLCDGLWREDLQQAPPPLEREVGSERETLHWADFYASADPVPNGPLFTAGDETWLREQEVWNYASIIRDHTTYAASEDDFMGSLVREAFLATGVQLPDEAEAHLSRARWRGWWRVWWLTFARALTAIATVVTVWRVWGHIPGIGHRVIHWGNWEPAHTVGKAVVKSLQKFIILGDLKDEQLVGGLTVLAVLIAGYALVSVVWSFWQRQDIKRFYRRMHADVDTDPLGGREFGWFLLTLLLLSAFAVSVIVYGEYAVPWNWTTDHLGLSFLFLATAALLPLLAMWPLRRPLRKFESYLMDRFPRDGGAESEEPVEAPPVLIP